MMNENNTKGENLKNNERKNIYYIKKVYYIIIVLQKRNYPFLIARLLENCTNFELEPLTSIPIMNV